MTPETVMALGQQAIMILLMVAAPLLLAALVIGLVISVFQAATQINEQTLSFIPKLLGILAVLVILGPWMLSILTDYLHNTLINIPNLAE